MTNRLTTTLLAAAAALTFANGANAADLYRGPAYKAAPSYVETRTWSGPYIGIVAGYAFGDYTFGGTDVSANGFNIGGTLGYNFQAGSWVFGVEADGSYSTVDAAAACVAPGDCNLSNNFLATARARIGYAGWGSFMPYITGGAAYGDIEVESGSGSVRENRFGYAIGGGLEYAFASRWSAKLEYLYVDLGEFTCPASTCGVATEVGYTTNIVRAGLNYRF